MELKCEQDFPWASGSLSSVCLMSVCIERYSGSVVNTLSCVLRRGGHSGEASSQQAEEEADQRLSEDRDQGELGPRSTPLPCAQRLVEYIITRRARYRGQIWVFRVQIYGDITQVNN